MDLKQWISIVFFAVCGGALAGPPEAGDPSGKPPEIIEKTEFEYSGPQRKARVLIDIHLSREGSIQDITTKQSSGSPEFDEVVRQWISTWRFSPALRAGKPVESHFQYGFQFAASAEPARVLALPPSIYPEKEKNLGHEGTTKMDIDIREDGSIADVRVIQTSGWPVLDQAAVEWVRGTTFSPAIDADGRPVASSHSQSLNFKIQMPKKDDHSDALVKIRMIWNSFHIYQMSSTHLLDACADTNADTNAALQRLLDDLSGLQDRLSWLEKFFETNNSTDDPPLNNDLALLQMAHEDELGLAELKAASGNDKNMRCKEITEGFLGGATTFEHFDKNAYSLMKKIKQERVRSAKVSANFADFF